MSRRGFPFDLLTSSSVFRFLFALCLRCSLVHALSVSANPPTVYAFKGTNATLSCSYTLDPGEGIKFFRWDIYSGTTGLSDTILSYEFANKKVNIIKTNRTYEFKEPLQLLIPGVGDADFRSYACNLFLTNFVQMNAVIELKLPVSPKMTLIKPAAVVVDQVTDIHCMATDGVPTPKIGWTLAGVDITANASESTNGNNVTSTLSLTPRESNDGAQLQCFAMYDVATPIDQTALSDSANLVVHVLPSTPNITSYSNGTWLRAGTRLTINCQVSSLGKPTGKLILSKRSDPQFSTDNQSTSIEYSLDLTESLNGQEVECRAENEASNATGQVFTDVVSLSVAFGPASAPIISGNDSIVRGDNATFACLASNANPAPLFTWRVGSVTMLEKVAARSVSAGANGGDVARSDFVVDNLKASQNGMEVACETRNPVTDVVQTSTKSLTVFFGPSNATLRGVGVGVGDLLIEGRLYDFECLVEKLGNPQSFVKVFRVDVGENKTEYNASLSSSSNIFAVSINASRSIDGSNLTCFVTNNYENDATSTISLGVAFGPDFVVITGNDTASDGDNVTLTCETRASNPSSSVIWRDVDTDAILSSVSDPPQADGSVKSTVVVSATAARHPIRVVCVATNNVSGSKVSANHVINVFHPPSAPRIDAADWAVNGTDYVIVCRVDSPGYPLANLTLTLDGITTPQIQENDTTVKASIPVDQSLKGKILGCSADNGQPVAPDGFNKTIQVGWDAPSVSISGPPSGAEFAVVTVTCEARGFNPNASHFQWRRSDGGAVTLLATTFHDLGNEGFGLTQSANSSLIRPRVILWCELMNSATGNTASSQNLTVETSYPPSPRLTGIPDYLPVGSDASIVCDFASVEDAGNPSANLTLRVGGVDVGALRHNLTTTLMDEKKVVECAAEQHLLSTPIKIEKMMKVSTGPSAVTLSTSADPGAENVSFTLTCEGSQVEPEAAATVTWRRAGVVITPSDSPRTQTDATFGTGKLISLHRMTPTFEDDGVIFECVVANPHVPNSEKTSTKTLDVTFAPRFSCDERLESGVVSVTCSVLSNPKADVRDVGFSFPDGVVPTDVVKTDAGVRTVGLNFSRPPGDFEYVVHAGAAKRAFRFNATGATPPPPVVTAGLSVNEWIVVAVASVVALILLVIIIVVLCRKKPRKHNFTIPAGGGYAMQEDRDKREMESGFYRSKPSQTPDVVGGGFAPSEAAAAASAGVPHVNLGFEPDSETPPPRPAMDLESLTGDDVSSEAPLHPRTPGPVVIYSRVSKNRGPTVPETRFTSPTLDADDSVAPLTPRSTHPATEFIPGAVSTPPVYANGDLFPKLPFDEEATTATTTDLNSNERLESEEKDGIVTWTDPVWL